MSRALRLAAALLPWLVLAGWTSTHMLWFLQRPWYYRLVAWLACAACSAALTRTPAGDDSADVARVPVVLAALAALVGIQGVSLGLSPTGLLLSVGMSVAAVLLWNARLGGRIAGLKALAVVLATVVAVGATEVAIRFFKIAQTARETDSRDLARRFNNLTPPGTAFVNRPSVLDEFPPALVEINAAGMRGPEIESGQPDLLLLGDSFVEARQLPWQQTLGPRLQAALGPELPGARVVAHGMRGWSPLLEWNWYLKAGRRFQPRVVLLFFFWNDLWTAGTEARTFRAVLDQRGRPEHFDARVDPFWIWYKSFRLVRIVDEVVRLASASGVRRLFQNAAASDRNPPSLLNQEAAEARGRRLAPGPPFTPEELNALLKRPADRLTPDLRRVVSTGFWPGIRPLEVWSADQHNAARQTEHELASFAADVAADGGRLVIVYVPNPLQIGPGECSVGRFADRVGPGVVLPPDSGIQAWLREVSARRGIEFLDPSAEMRQAASEGGRPPLYLRADCHWSPAGHQFMADWLSRWYVRSGRR